MITPLKSGMLALSLLAWALPSQAASKAERLQVDTAASRVDWLGKKVTGQHNGSLKLKSGEVTLDKGKLTGGQFDIDMTSLTNEDIKDAEYNAKLIGHLKSDDFFSVEKFPVASFKITGVKPVSGKAEATHEITGDLTIKGITHPVTFPASVSIKGGRLEAKGSANVDRTKWNIRYGSGKFFQGLGDKVISDEFKVDLNVVTGGAPIASK